MKPEIIERKIEEIKNKIAPTEYDEAILYLFTQVTKLKYENTELQEKLQRLSWTLQEHD